MSKNTLTSLSIAKIYCAIFGHDYRLSKEVTGHVSEYQCTHCKKEVTTNVRGHIETMTPKLKEINAVLEKVHAKKMARKTAIPNQYQVAS